MNRRHHDHVVDLGAYRQERELAEANRSQAAIHREMDAIRRYRLAQLSPQAENWQPPPTTVVALGPWLYGQPERHGFALAALSECLGAHEEGFLSRRLAEGALNECQRALAWGSKGRTRVWEQLVGTGRLWVFHGYGKESWGAVWGAFTKSELVAGAGLVTPGLTTERDLACELMASWFSATPRQRAHKLQRLLPAYEKLHRDLGWQTSFWPQGLVHVLEWEGLL